MSASKDVSVKVEGKGDVKTDGKGNFETEVKRDGASDVRLDSDSLGLDFHQKTYLPANPMAKLHALFLFSYEVTDSKGSNRNLALIPVLQDQGWNVHVQRGVVDTQQAMRLMVQWCDIVKKDTAQIPWGADVPPPSAALVFFSAHGGYDLYPIPKKSPAPDKSAPPAAVSASSSAPDKGVAAAAVALSTPPLKRV
jgi:hypothetical protein